MKIAILGFGVVGSGAYETAKDHPECGVEVKRILDVRVPAGMEGIVTTDYQTILDDPEIGVVAEAIGGLHPAYEFVCAAMRAKKSVVSANKFLICRYYRELHELARAEGVSLRFTPSVGGGIPWLYNLKRVMRDDTVDRITGIMNGTTNFILDAMTKRGADFAEVLKEAQKLGYAEADPSADVDGLDVRRKCAISASVAFGTVLTEDDVPTFGIRNAACADVAFAAREGYVLKLMANAVRGEGGVCACVEPVFLPSDAVESAVGTNFNCISLFAKRAGRLSFIGQGAGKDPTGSALLLDCIDVATGGGSDTPAYTEPSFDDTLIRHPYYVRSTASLQKEITAKRGDGYAVTVPLTPAAMHKYASDVLAEDPAAFFAALPEQA